MPVKDWLPAAVRAAAAERKLKAGETVFHLGDKTVGFYEVVAGRVRLSRINRSGREVILYVAGPGETIAEASLFSPTYHCDAVAGSDALVRIFPKAAILAVFENDPKAARTFTAALARQVMDLRTRLEQRNIRSARERVRHYLNVNAGEDGRTVEITGTLKDVAAELGISHEALYRTLAGLQRAGEIRRARGKIVLSRPRRI
jgi:CRP-like cAMP-binding protein